MRAAALLGLVAETDFVQKTLAATWPDDVRSDIDQLARASAVIGQLLQGGR